MSRKGVSKYIHLNTLHEEGEWRTRSRFESIYYAKTDSSRGVVALFNNGNDYIREKGYSKPLFAIVWDENSKNDAYVFHHIYSLNEIEEKRISKELAEHYEKARPDEKFLYQLFELDLPLPSGMRPSDIEITNDGNDSLFHDLSVLISLEDSQREQLIHARIGQGKFRKDVISVWGREVCAVTLTPIKEMLVASHIKAWRNCETTNERLDGANGILLCAHIDRLFDQHLITFQKVGNEYRLKFSERLDKSLMKGLGIIEGDALASGRLNANDRERFESYLNHHQSIFEELYGIKLN